VIFVPVPSICLASLVTSLAIKADAFEPSIDSVDTLLRRPTLENVDYLPLEWKKEILETSIIPLDYRTYRHLWHLACLAAGLRQDPRLYTLRVGVGMDLDGKVAPSSPASVLTASDDGFGSQASSQTCCAIMSCPTRPLSSRRVIRQSISVSIC
jgi:hypothetical protein